MNKLYDYYKHDKLNSFKELLEYNYKKDKNAEYDLSDNLCPCLHIGRHTFLYNAAQYDAAIITGVVAYSATLLFCVYDNTETNLTAFLNLSSGLSSEFHVGLNPSIIFDIK